ncbi:hypothetical protein QPM04_26760, partial [Massilia varians]
ACALCAWDSKGCAYSGNRGPRNVGESHFALARRAPRERSSRPVPTLKKACVHAATLDYFTQTATSTTAMMLANAMRRDLADEPVVVEQPKLIDRLIDFSLLMFRSH